jgi:hypothetical protein
LARSSQKLGEGARSIGDWQSRPRRFLHYLRANKAARILSGGLADAR